LCTYIRAVVVSRAGPNGAQFVYLTAVVFASKIHKPFLQVTITSNSSFVELVLAFTDVV
jgi:hypothetical protein